jgi:hypothetical protein
MFFTSRFEFFNTSGIKIYAAIGPDDMINLKILQFKSSYHADRWRLAVIHSDHRTRTALAHTAVYHDRLGKKGHTRSFMDMAANEHPGLFFQNEPAQTPAPRM